MIAGGGPPVVPYDPTWPETFSAIERSIAPALEGLGFSIEHVGSTAVPGLAAKPIIDLDVVLADPADVSAAIARLQGCGYRHEGDLGVPGREAFRQPVGLPAHHLYLVVESAGPHRDHIDLRDYLRHHPEEAHRYARRKQQLKEVLARDRLAYSLAKEEVIRDLLRKARGEGRAGVSPEERGPPA